MDTTQPPNEEIDRDWAVLLAEAANAREPGVTAHTFLRRWPSFSSPVALRCDDGKEYVVKGQHAGRAIVNDQIVARLGMAIGAPVGRPQIVYIPPELKAIEPQLADITEGSAHGTLLIQNCSDRQWIMHANVAENRIRFALLAVLYGWCFAGDHQLIYENDRPFLVHSVDHGHFYPGGPTWSTATIKAAPPAVLEQPIVRDCLLTNQEQVTALRALEMADDNAVIQAVASPPDEWGLSMDERVALLEFIIERRDQLLAIIPTLP